MRYPLSFILTLLYISLWAQPQPGDWFREYPWTILPIENNEQFLRVGGKLDYQVKTPYFPEESYKDGNILIPGEVDLNKALRAELMVEKNLCHDYTSGLSVSVNDHPKIVFPEADGIPEPQEGYLHHNFPVVEVPLEYLKKGENNIFKLSVDTFQHWGWPQNLVYGVVLRVYYRHYDKDLPTVILPENRELVESQPLSINYSKYQKIEKVEYLAHYYGPDMNGDGIYTDWHYGWFKTSLVNHIGTSTKAPFNIIWNTTWVPDQEKQVKIVARITFKQSGLIYMTEAVEGLNLKRDFHVKFYPPYQIPQTWTTRNAEYNSAFYFNDDKTKVDTIKVIWRSWSPGYMNGVYLNDVLFFIREGDRYCYAEHDLKISDRQIIDLLNPGPNYIKTGKTPEFNWQMVHGMDVLYPGPMVLMRLRK